METLHGLLTERGILVFSTHDESLLPPAVAMPPEGILFLSSSESRTLDTQQYGSNYVAERFVSRVIDQVTAGKARLHRIPRGLVGFQDLYILPKDPNRDIGGLRFVHDPCGCFDGGELTPDGRACLSGWAADLNPGGCIKEVQFLAKGRVIDTVTPSHERPDVAAFFQRSSALRSGWNCELPRNRVRSGNIIEIKVVNNKNRSLIIAYDHLKSMLRRGKAAG